MLNGVARLNCATRTIQFSPSTQGLILIAANTYQPGHLWSPSPSHSVGDRTDRTDRTVHRTGQTV
eukprot:354033-Chlamydomonas_euryale.AAC.3